MNNGQRQAIPTAMYTQLLRRIVDLKDLHEAEFGSFHRIAAKEYMTAESVAQANVQDPTGARARELLLSAAAHLILSAEKNERELEKINAKYR